jgi:hypothetical protein
MCCGAPIRVRGERSGAASLLKESALPCQNCVPRPSSPPRLTATHQMRGTTSGLAGHWLFSKPCSAPVSPCSACATTSRRVAIRRWSWRHRRTQPSRPLRVLHARRGDDSSSCPSRGPPQTAWRGCTRGTVPRLRTTTRRGRVVAGRPPNDGGPVNLRPFQVANSDALRTQYLAGSEDVAVYDL